MTFAEKPVFELVDPESPFRAFNDPSGRWVVRMITPVQYADGEWQLGCGWGCVVAEGGTRAEAILRFRLEYPGETLYSAPRSSADECPAAYRRALTREGLYVGLRTEEEGL